MPVAAGISAAGSLASSAIGYFGAKDAAKQQANAAAQALAFQQQVFDYNKGLNAQNANLNQNTQNSLAPWTTSGGNAAYSLANLYGLGPTGSQGTSDGFDAFTQLPAYQFPLQQGMKALTQNLNAQGKNMSGAQLREAQQFGSGLASTYFMSNYVNPLQTMAGQGLSAAGIGAQSNNTLMSANVGAANNNTQGAQQIGNTIGNIGQANAAGIVGGTNALSGGLSGGANSLALYSMLSKGGGGGGGLSTTYGSGSSPYGLTGTNGDSPVWTV